MAADSPDRFLTVAEPGGASVLIQGSKFLAWLAPAETADDAQHVLEKRNNRYPDATHHCWAWRVGRPGDLLERFSDAGEPSGTAGRPMIDALRNAGIENAACVVSRYFGGTKLGTGGLARAYAFAVESALGSVPLIERTIKQRIEVDFDHERTGPLFRVLDDFGLRLVPSLYDARGHGAVLVPASKVAPLVARIGELARTGIDLSPGELLLD